MPLDLLKVGPDLRKHTGLYHLLARGLIDVERPVLLQQVFLVRESDSIHLAIKRMNPHASLSKKGGVDRVPTPPIRCNY